jgi:hypothetical protein
MEFSLGKQSIAMRFMDRGAIVLSVLFWSVLCPSLVLWACMTWRLSTVCGGVGAARSLLLRWQRFPISTADVFILVITHRHYFSMPTIWNAKLKSVQIFYDES